MPRTPNTERMQQQEAKYRAREAKAKQEANRYRHSLLMIRNKGHRQRITDLGMLLHDQFPDKDVLDITQLLASATWNTNGNVTHRSEARSLTTKKGESAENIENAEATHTIWEGANVPHMEKPKASPYSQRTKAMIDQRIAGHADTEPLALNEG